MKPKQTIFSVFQLVGDAPTNYDHLICDAIAFTPVKVRFAVDMDQSKLSPPVVGISNKIIAIAIRANLKKDSDRFALPVVGKQQSSVEDLLHRIKENSQRSPRTVKLLSVILAKNAGICTSLIEYPYGACPFCGCPIEYPGLDSSYCVSCHWMPTLEWLNSQPILPEFTSKRKRKKH